MDLIKFSNISYCFDSQSYDQGVLAFANFIVNLCCRFFRADEISPDTGDVSGVNA